MGVGIPAAVDPQSPEGDCPPLRSEVIQSRPRPALSPRSAEEAARLTDLLRTHYASVWRTLRRLGVAEAHSDDAAQEVFIVLSRRLPDVRLGSERTFLLGCAVRVAANHRRTWYSRHEVADERALADEHDPRPTAEQVLDGKQLREALDEALDGWPEDIRTAFVLFELEGLSMPEIAQVTEAKLGTVASRLRRSRELFQLVAKRLRARGAGGAR
ncbi:MAG: polymerase sigma factor RpoE [Polyangiaceae bacterium]|nr:polymerase sigma factor RpoE [Polyangiaceae bacterium]